MTPVVLLARGSIIVLLFVITLFTSQFVDSTVQYDSIIVCMFVLGLCGRLVLDWLIIILLFNSILHFF